MKTQALLAIGAFILTSHTVKATVRRCEETMLGRISRAQGPAEYRFDPSQSDLAGKPRSSTASHHFQTSIELLPEQIQILSQVNRKYNIARRSIVSTFSGMSFEVNAVTSKIEEGFEVVFGQGKGQVSKSEVTVLSLDFLVADSLTRLLVPGGNRPLSNIFENAPQSFQKTRPQILKTTTEWMKRSIASGSEYYRAMGIDLILTFDAQNLVTGIQITYSKDTKSSDVANTINMVLDTLDRSF